MSAVLSPIDPFTAMRPGCYRDALVDVVRGGVAPAGALRTPSFAVWTDREQVHLAHRLAPAEIDNDLAGRVAAELFAPGWLSGSELFERLVTGIVVSSADEPLAAWENFYRNTLARLEELAWPGSGSVAGPDAGAGTGHVEGSLAEYAPVYAHARSLISTHSVLELGSCFGFFSLLLAGGHAVTASDVTANTVRLLARVAPGLGLVLDALICDAARVPRSDGAYGTVVALHLLEHLGDEHGRAVVAEAQRLADRRVVVAVPFEDEPTAAYGHVRTFDLDRLTELGRASGWEWSVHEHHGGWLVLDRP